MAASACVVGTWPFSREPVRKAMQCLSNYSTSLDAVEAGIHVAEVDPNYGPYHVGCGGWQNSDLVLELDAAIMNGTDMNFGAVTALTGFAEAISVARQVMEKSPHSMLTGPGAARFARAQGFQFQENMGRHPKPQMVVGVDKQRHGHDTLGILALDKQGNICAGVSTSGMSGKLPGRVGDSALPGCGLYADSQAGAACCSGDGDEILRYCPSYKVVDLLKQGYSPQNACLSTAKEIMRRRGTRGAFEMVVIALDNKGNQGAANIGVHSYKDEAAGIQYAGFPFVTLSDNMTEAQVTCSPPISEDQL
ncbi:unnamed protein product [Candidula unifasciata]|uniref:Uncharacterized protein n=1 Tax=Candidula unifasciata TaxID=100452 RepID=A0A8S4A145_9EUPU|nr:unnamed protein product [Candidula unifasciata]